MDIRDIKLFKHLSTSLHFGKTSQACNISPSGLTRTIQRMENEVGKPLFNRNKRTVSLTTAGKLFCDYADNVLQLWNKLQSDLTQNGLLQGKLTLYCSVTAILSILPAILERFRDAHPQIHINLQTGDAAMAINRLERGEADVSIAALPDSPGSHIHFIKLLETPLIFIAPKNYPEVITHTGGHIDWQQTPVILAERGLSRKRTEAWFRHKQISPNIYAQVAGNEAIITLVSMGCGVGVIPELVLLKSPLRNQVRVLNTFPKLQPFSVGVCTTIKNLNNPIVNAFLQNVAASRSGDYQ